MENTGIIPEVSNVEVEASAPEAVEAVASEGKKLEGANDPNESFDSWLKRTESEKKGSSNDKKTETKEAASKDSGKKEATKEEAVSNNKADPKADASKAPETVESPLKVGDKEYKAKDIESMSKQLEDYKANEGKTARQLQDLVKILQEDPAKVFNKLGIKKELIEEYLWKNHYEYETLSPEQKIAKLEGEKKSQLEASAKAEQEAKDKAQYESNRIYWTGVIKEGLDSQGLPETEWTVQRMAGYIKRAKDQGINASHHEIAKLVREDMENAQKAAVAGLSAEQLAKVLGEDAVKALRQHEVDRLKQAKFENKAAVPQHVERSKKTGKKITNIYDLLED